jgi:hypothetical protein
MVYTTDHSRLETIALVRRRRLSTIALVKPLPRDNSNFGRERDQVPAVG